jgi:hypothetical protein
MNLVIDNTVEVNGNEKNDIGMVVSNCLIFHLLSNALFAVYFGMEILLPICSDGMMWYLH